MAILRNLHPYVYTFRFSMRYFLFEYSRSTPVLALGTGARREMRVPREAPSNCATHARCDGERPVSRTVIARLLAYRSPVCHPDKNPAGRNAAPSSHIWPITVKPARPGHPYRALPPAYCPLTPPPLHKTTCARCEPTPRPHSLTRPPALLERHAGPRGYSTSLRAATH